MTSFSPDGRVRPGVSRHRGGDEAWAAVGYLGVPFVSVAAPLAVYVARARSSDYARAHARQALNLSVTLALYNLCADPRLNHELPVVPGVREAECAALLRDWFASRRS